MSIFDPYENLGSWETSCLFIVYIEVLGHHMLNLSSWFQKNLDKKKKKVCKQKHKFTHTAQCTTCADIDSASSKTVLSTISLWLVRLTVRATKMSQCFSPLTLFCSVCKTGSGKRSPSFRPNDPCQCLASSVITQWCYRLLSLKQL